MVMLSEHFVSYSDSDSASISDSDISMPRVVTVTVTVNLVFPVLHSIIACCTKYCVMGREGPGFHSHVCVLTPEGQTRRTDTSHSNRALCHDCSDF